MIFTARVRSTREGNIYTWECLSVHHCGGGYPISGLVAGGIPHPRPGGVPHPRSGGTHPRSGWGVPHPRSGRGVPHPRSGWGGTPSQVLLGIPHLRSGGYPSQVGVVLHLRSECTRVPPYLDLGRGTPLPEMGYPPLHTAA